MANVRAKVFEYTTSVDRDLRVSSEGEQPVEFGESWTPEHILLAALLRCAIASLTYYATPAGIVVAVAGEAHGTVTLREDEGVFGLVAADARFDLELTPQPEPEALVKLLRKAKAGCFVSNSLSVHPEFHWRVNGADVDLT